MPIWEDIVARAARAGRYRGERDRRTRAELAGQPDVRASPGSAHAVRHEPGTGGPAPRL